jgi:hypothetical protein
LADPVKVFSDSHSIINNDSALFIERTQHD